MAIPLSNGLRALFSVLGCLMVATLIYTIYVDGFPFRRDLLTPWMAATLVDFYINIIALAAWITYKESNFITATVWIVLLICSGSIATCAYIFIQLLKLSPEESLQDPLYHVLLRHENNSAFAVVVVQSLCLPCVCVLLTTPDLIRCPESVTFGSCMLQLGYNFFVHTPLPDDGSLNATALAHALTNRLTYRGAEQKTKQSAVVTARIAFSILGLLMLGTLIYTLITDGSPFRKELLTPWMIATLIDFYINVVALSVGLGCLQGIKLDQCILMDIVIDLLWEHYYLRLHSQTAAAAYFSRSSLPDLIQ
ncbi:hypothetical protein POTOM_007590 [Populus tomentosa]|uniref:Transmembrane protein n=1 Tax=Populus tomentosa TaxID=118781 RepID=A0A8X8ACY1_POPTO|nr:hypothetical protein POTOM_007590 [Populus tomentosa]